MLSPFRVLCHQAEPGETAFQTTKGYDELRPCSHAAGVGGSSLVVLVAERFR